MTEMHRPQQRDQRSRMVIQTAIPELTRSITLKTAYAQRVYRRTFERLKADLYVLTVRLHANGLEDAAKVLENQCEEEFTKIGSDLNREIERVDVLMSDAGVQGEASYERSETYQAKFSTPLANEFLNLLVRMDSLLARYDVLWLMKTISTHARVDNSINWQRRLTKAANSLRARGNQARAKCAEIYRDRMKRTKTHDAAGKEPTEAPVLDLDDAGELEADLTAVEEVDGADVERAAAVGE